MTLNPLLHIDVELALKEALDRHLTHDSHPEDKTPQNLADSIRYSLLSAGKRIRPRLSLACSGMLKLPESAALPAALSVEMIHCFTLIHDDLPCMDNDDFRRGKPSNHKVFGEGVALLAGDALMALAFDVFSEAAPHVESPHFVTALRRLLHSTGPRGVMGGQAAESLLDQNSPLQALTRMHAQKTGALFAASLLVPMDLAGITEDSTEGIALTAYARELGLAFQIADDLEDAEEKPKPTSILFYLSAEEARKMTLQRLDAATQSLVSIWGHSGSALSAISEEVMNKLKQAGPA